MLMGLLKFVGAALLVGLSDTARPAGVWKKHPTDAARLSLKSAHGRLDVWVAHAAIELAADGDTEITVEVTGSTGDEFHRDTAFQPVPFQPGMVRTAADRRRVTVFLCGPAPGFCLRVRSKASGVLIISRNNVPTYSP